MLSIDAHGHNKSNPTRFSFIVYFTLLKIIQHPYSKPINQIYFNPIIVVYYCHHTTIMLSISPNHHNAQTILAWYLATKLIFKYQQ